MVRIPDAANTLDRYPHQLSGGMRQRILIAIAIAQKQKVIFADEPTTALDVTVQADIMDLLVNLQKETKVSMILISHNINLATERVDRILVMYCGKLLEIATKNQILDNPCHPYTIGLMNCVPHIGMRERALKAIPGEIESILESGGGCPFYSRCTHAFGLCKQRLPELLEIENGHYCRCHNVNKNSILTKNKS